MKIEIKTNIDGTEEVCICVDDTNFYCAGLPDVLSFKPKNTFLSLHIGQFLKKAARCFIVERIAQTHKRNDLALRTEFLEYWSRMARSLEDPDKGENQ